MVDLDGASGVDVIVRQPNAISWYRNTDGLGSFAGSDTLHVSLDLLDACDFADVDADGDLDLVVADRGADAILLLRNEGAGAFGSPEVVVEMNGGVAGAIHLVDAFGSPEPELFYRSGGVVALPNEGGSFGTTELVLTTGGFSFDFQVLDVDEDGDPDLASFNGLNPTLIMLRNPRGRRTMGTHRVLLHGQPWWPPDAGFGCGWRWGPGYGQRGQSPHAMVAFPGGGKCTVLRRSFGEWNDIRPAPPWMDRPLGLRPRCHHAVDGFHRRTGTVVNL